MVDSGGTVVVERRFNGPPDSVHGGYACAIAAQLLDWSAAVTLRKPPPLERPLSVRRDESSVALMDGDETVIEARPARLELEVPAPVSLAEAEAASAASTWRDAAKHPFPTCFGCGPVRPPGDGLFQFPGPVEGRPELRAAVWNPDPTLADASGDVLPIFAFSALDCPSAAGAIEVNGGEGVHVLARLTGRLVAPVEAGVPHVVISWPTRTEPRKRYSGVAIFSDGELRALGESLWIQLRDPGTFAAQPIG